MSKPRPPGSTIRLVEFGEYLLTRNQGERARTQIFAQLQASGPVLVSFEGVLAATPSFVDECLGRLMIDLGLQRFRADVKLESTSLDIRRLVNKVLTNRIDQSSGPDSGGRS